ncbi:Xylose isomerase domain protein TIM barrel [Fibrella aestuarina BUZ 2]|uniref:Xylose isomerase domain protein TIM barrel n=1 Tax=Fibrella aestuarina BUZ 2 TaxID=1166018 RepID=I0KDT5_9BACT|nr:TIM barrel protein [Fibrella aestuarina]CCH02288.1 Xylose isomerase domain protein TIM barrel [Fibrella aestuarina BUZ 2]
MQRRNALRTLTGTALSLTAVPSFSQLMKEKEPLAPTQPAAAALKGNINHSVCRWCYSKISLEDLCKAAKSIGIKSIELVGPEEWPTLQKYGLTSALPWGAGKGITDGFNDPKLHDELVASYEGIFPKLKAAGLTTVICFSGNRRGMSDEVGIENCAKGLKRLMPSAEKYGITMIMELLNSKVDHKDYMCDHTAWGVKLCKAVGSERFKLLYDIYHMQIMEGDIIRTIRDSSPYIGHYHTGGNPGRNEIDETQEINYPAVMKAIVATGYKGFVAQEFIPKRDPLTSLREAVNLCDV